MHKVKDVLADIAFPDELFEGKFFLAGGSARDFLQGQDARDVDLFFSSEEWARKVQDKLTEKGYLITFECPQGRLTNLASNKGFTVQLVKIKFFQNVRELLDDFDFTVAQVAWDGRGFHFGERTLVDLANKTLYLNKLQYPRAMLQRIIKYAGKGYTFHPNFDVDFLTGVRHSEFTDEAWALYRVD